MEFDNYEVDQVVGRKKIRSLATSCFNDKLVFLTAARCFVLVNMVCWFVWEGVKFLINWSISLHFFFYFHEIYLFFVFSHNLFQKRFLLESLVCCVIHYTEILRVLFFVNCILRAQSDQVFSKCFFTAPLVQFSTICFEVKLDTN